MEEKQLNKIIAEKISYYRKQSGLTQGALAEKINYSDKSVSKWERGEGTPDIFVLVQLAEIFSVTVNDLVSDEPYKKTVDTTPMKKRLISVLSIGLVWLVAAVTFFVLSLLDISTWVTHRIFLYALPATFIVMTVFSCIWYKTAMKVISISGLIWTVFLSLRLTFSSSVFNTLIIVCAVFQVITAIWFYMRYKTKNTE